MAARTALLERSSADSEPVILVRPNLYLVTDWVGNAITEESISVEAIDEVEPVQLNLFPNVRRVEIPLHLRDRTCTRAEAPANNWDEQLALAGIPTEPELFPEDTRHVPIHLQDRESIPRAAAIIVSRVIFGPDYRFRGSY